MVCFDSDVLIALMKGDESAAESVRTHSESAGALRITAISAYELYKGAYISSDPAHNLDLVRRTIAGLQLVTLSEDSVLISARLNVELRRKGKPIGESDVLIAGIVLSIGEKLVTRDRHFQAVRELDVQIW